jgi:phosphohistidine phosphatase
MKTLFLLRHAKSSWDNADQADFDRQLNGRGLAAAPFMGNLMAEEDLLPGVIVSSPAERAKATAELVRQGGRMDAEILFDDLIYEASPGTLLSVASKISAEFESAMIVGHNPGVEGFIRVLTGISESMPTAALAIVQLDISSWRGIAPGSGTLVEVIRPKEKMRAADREKLTRP